MLTEFDYFVCVLFVVVIARGFFYGFFAQITALMGFLLGGWLSNRYCNSISKYIPYNWPGGHITQKILAILLIFSITFLFFTYLGQVIRKLICLLNLRGFDAVLGCIFGAIHGIVFVILIYIFVNMTSLPKYPFWTNSYTRPVIEKMILYLQPHLPTFLNKLIKNVTTSEY